MNARLAKETRSLLPTFGLTLAATVVLSCLLDGSDASGIVVFVFTACCALMGAVGFGSEFQAKTMPLLLAQPVPRQRMWFEKMLVLGIALAISYAVLLASLSLLIRGEGRTQNYFETGGAAFLLVLCAFCATPGITLMTKNTLLGFGNSFSIPMALIGALLFAAWLGAKLLDRPDFFLFAAAFDAHPYRFIAGGALVYCASFYWLGNRRFRHFEAIDTQGRELSLPLKLQSGFVPLLQKFLPSYSGPTKALIRKELLLQRANFMVAGLMFGLSPLFWLIWKLHPSEYTGTFVMITIIIPVTLIPILTGGIAVAEERNWGTMGWQLTLPVSPLKQWLVKIAVACFTCLLLGVAVPLVLVSAGYCLEHGSFEIANEHLATAKHVSVLYLTVFAMMLYSSSASNNTLRAILFGFGLVIASGTIIGLMQTLIARVMPQVILSGFINPQHVRYWLMGNGQDQEKIARSYYLVCSVLGAMCATLLTMLYAFAQANFRNGELVAVRWQRQLPLFLTVLTVFAAVVMAFIWLSQNTSQ